MLAWSTYDLANTLFSINILSLYFPLWVTQDRGGSDLLYAVATSVSIFVASLLMPFLGALSDHLQRRMIFLVPTTFLCVMATALLSRISSLGWGLFFFGIANVGYQLGLLFYDALLPEVGSKETIGKVSGLGVSLGYCGTLIGLAIVRPFVLTQGYQAAFLPTALFFLLFSLPCFLIVRDLSPAFLSPSFSLLHATSQRFKKGMEHFKKGTPLRPFVKAHFFSLMAIQPVILFMSVYTQKVIGLNDREMITFFFLTTLFAIVSAFVAGIFTDRFGAKRILLLSLGGWCAGFLCAILATLRWHFWFTGGLIGTVMGSTWVASRVLVIRFTSREYLAEVFGCLGLIGRLAAITGPLVWGSVVWLFKSHFPWNYRGALFCLLVWMTIAFWILLKKVPGETFLKSPP
ncbi:MAG: MFS transporter [Candidatus Omnitrophica bacterium]|nr:MFS transporter [Candidatus Omnitrophota bacterium]